MPTPPKPVIVLEQEKRSHRTKREKELRKQGEQSLLTGKKLTERQEVKAVPVAHKEYRRVKALMEAIGKNDAIYTAIINRYCMIYAECHEQEEWMEELRAEMKRIKEDLNNSKITKGKYFRLMGDLQEKMSISDSICAKKRKMLLDIEKECVMTISAALRSIPKKVEKEEPEDPMAALLERRRA